MKNLTSTTKSRVILILSLLGLCYACQTVEFKPRVAKLNLPSTPYVYSADTANNGIPTLGRVLFYDTRLSVNSSVSCASCHKQALAFADNVSLSLGFENRRTLRNSMPIQNLDSPPNAFEGQGSLSLFWDGREKLLAAMVLRPITNHIEMGITDLDALSQRIASIGEYSTLFAKAYGSPEVTEIKIAQALSEFLSSIESNNSRFDRMLRGESQLTALESTGHELFFGKYNCNNCHQTQALNGYEMGGGFVNIGLDQSSVDPGFADVTGNSFDRGKFKIPTLRNVALTAPYMHDGRFATLDDVLNHYSEGIANNANLDIRLRDPSMQPLKMNISDPDKQAIIAFLNTLTDYSMITDPRFSNPFEIN